MTAPTTTARVWVTREGQAESRQMELQEDAEGGVLGVRVALTGRRLLLVVSICPASAWAVPLLRANDGRGVSSSSSSSSKLQQLGYKDKQQHLLHAPC
jgi:hypothetical protein